MTAFILTAVLSLTGNETKPEPTLDEKVATRSRRPSSS